MRRLSEGFKRKFGVEEVLSRHRESLPVRKKSRMIVDWSKLPNDVLVRIIEEHMVSVEEFTMFSCVCRAWCEAAAVCDMVKLRGKWSHSDQIPWLMQTNINDEILIDEDVEVECHAPSKINNQGVNYLNGENCQCKGKAKIGPDKIYRRKLWDIRISKHYNICCPQGYGKVCWGSPYGWIVNVGLDHKMYMFNPLTKSRLSLPPRTAFPCSQKREVHVVTQEYFINKVVVVKVPKGAYTHGVCGSDDAEILLAVAMYGYVGTREGLGRVAIGSPGDLQWTGLEWSPSTIDDKPDLEDVLYHKNVGLLFVCKRGGLVYCDLRGNKQPLLLKWYKPRFNYISNRVSSPSALVARFKAYITNYGDDVFMVCRVILPEGCMGASYRDDYYQTSEIEVYQLDWNANDNHWIRKSSLPQDVAIFVGDNTTMAIRAPDAGCEGNCVYFADDSRRYFCYTQDREFRDGPALAVVICGSRATIIGAPDQGIFYSTTSYLADDPKRYLRRSEDKVGGYDAGVYNVTTHFIKRWPALHQSRSYSSPFWFRPSC